MHSGLRLATVDDVPRLAGVLADAFMNDPLYTWMLAGSLRVRPRLRAMFTAEMERYVWPKGGSVWTTSRYDGAVCELPPDGWEFPTTLTGKELLSWVRAFGLRLPRAIRVQRLLEERHLREPHFYVRIVGVRAARQGQGVGTALMRSTLERADAVGLPAYLEASTPRSAALYERLGFVHLGMLELADGGPRVWPMRRPPAASSDHAPER